MIDQVAEVKERSDIVEIVSSYLTLKKAGSNYKANCPFHNEKTPSLMISPERQSFKCFGCSEGGDVITFIEKIEGLDFYNSLKLLAERAGITLKSQSVKFGSTEHRADEKTRLFEINEWAKKVYHKILLDHPKAEKARAYLKKRGLSAETIAKFEIGYAPDSWDFILRFLKSKNYTDKEAVAAGLAIASERGKYFDRFRGRIVFPINNIMGNTVAFTTRILEDNPKEAKYINSAESPVYTKGKTIYGLDKAKMPIKEANQAILVEGNMDVVACVQAGFKNVVAVSGTALTSEQLRILNRYAQDIVLCFDMDNAGQIAMKRAIRLALANDISTKIITMPVPFKDPDEAIKADPVNWTKAVKAAKPSLEYWIDKMLSEHPALEVNDKKIIAKEILPTIKTIASSIEKEHYIQYLAQKLSISEQSLIDALEKSKVDREFTAAGREVPVESLLEMSVLERMVGLIWAEPSLIKKVKVDLTKNPPEKLIPVLKMIEAGEIEKDKIKPEDAAIYDQLAISALHFVDSDDEDELISELNYLNRRLRSDKLEDVKETYARKIKEAESTGDTAELKKLLSEFSELIK